LDGEVYPKESREYAGGILYSLDEGIRRRGFLTPLRRIGREDSACEKGLGNTLLHIC
jgi:hypothetical protein